MQLLRWPAMAWRAGGACLQGRVAICSSTVRPGAKSSSDFHVFVFLHLSCTTLSSPLNLQYRSPGYIKYVIKNVVYCTKQIPPPHCCLPPVLLVLEALQMLASFPRSSLSLGEMSLAFSHLSHCSSPLHSFLFVSQLSENKGLRIQSIS